MITFSNKTYILLTGSTGFLGSYLLRQMINNNLNIITIQRKKSNLWRIKDLKKKYVNYYEEEVNYDDIFKRYNIKVIVHTACEYGRINPSISKIFESNFFFGSHLLEKAIQYKVDCFINTDTFNKKNITLYSLSKKQFVELLKFNKNKIKIINLKIEHLFGPKDNHNKFIPWIISELYQQEKEINIFNSKEKRDFIYIDDVVEFYISIIKKYNILNKKYSEYNLGTGKYTSIKKIVIKIKEKFEYINGKSKTKVFFRKSQKDFKRLILRKNVMKNIGWKPKTNLDDGLLKTVKEFQKSNVKFYYRPPN